MGLLFDAVRVGRGMAKNRSVWVMLVGILSTCICVNATGLTLVNGIVFSSLPYRSAERLAILTASRADAFVSYSHYQSWDFEPIEDLRTNPLLSGVAAAIPGSLSIRGAGRVRASAVSDDFFSVLGVSPLAGRLFGTSDLRVSRRQVVLAEDLWRGTYGGHSDVLGNTVEINGRPFIVVGVVSRAVRFPDSPDVWIPRGVDSQLGGPTPSPTVVARLRFGVPFADVRADIVRLVKNTWGGRSPRLADSVRLQPLPEALPGKPGELLRLLEMAALLLLVASSVNTAGVILVRQSNQAREFAIMMALGATRRDVVRRIVLECFVLTVLSTTAAVPLTHWLVAGVKSFLPPIHGIEFVQVTWLGLALPAVFVLVVTALAAVIPTTWQWRRTSPRLSLSEMAAPTPPHRVHRSLIAVQTMSAVFLTVGASAIGLAVLRNLETDVGVSTKNVVVVQTELSPEEPATRGRVGNYYQRLEDKLRRGPGALAAGSISSLPGATDTELYVLTIHLEGREPVAGGGIGPKPVYLSATPGYFAAAGSAVVAGRTFNADDGRSSKVAIVSAGVAKALNMNPADLPGRRINLTPAMSDPTWALIVGVVEGELRMWGAEVGPRPAVFVPFVQKLPRTAAFTLVALRTDPLAAVRGIEEAASALDPAVAVFGIRTFESIRAEAIRDRKNTAIAIFGLGVATIAVALIGICGQGIQVVRSRTRELAVRAALGATPLRLRGQILLATAIPATIGVVIGVAASWGAWQLALWHGYDVGNISLASVVPAVVVLGLSLVASSLPVRHRTSLSSLNAFRN